MAANTLMDFLAGPAMSKLMATMTVQTGVERYLPTELWSKSRATIVGDKVVFNRFVGEQAPATVVSFNSAAVAYTPPPADKATLTALGSAEKMEVTPEMFYALNSDIPFVRQGAVEKMNIDLANFKARMEILQTDAVSSLFSCQGNISVGIDATSGLTAILGNTTNAMYTINFGVPSTNLFTKTTSYGGTTIGDAPSALGDAGKAGALTS